MQQPDNIKLSPAVPSLLPKNPCIRIPNIPTSTVDNSYLNNEYYQQPAYYNQQPINEPIYYNPPVFEYNPPSMQYIDYTNVNNDFLESLKFQMMTGCRRYQTY